VPSCGAGAGCSCSVPGRYLGRGSPIADCDRVQTTSDPSGASATGASAETPASSRTRERRLVPSCGASGEYPRPSIPSPSTRPLGGCGGRPAMLPSPLAPPLLAPARPLACAQAPCLRPAAVSGRCWAGRPGPATEPAPPHPSASESAKGSCSCEAACAPVLPPSTSTAAALLPRRRPSPEADRARLPGRGEESAAAPAAAGCGATTRQGTHDGSAAEGGGIAAAASSEGWPPADASHGIGVASSLPLPLLACSAACKSPQRMHSRCRRRTSAARGVKGACGVTGDGRVSSGRCCAVLPLAVVSEAIGAAPAAAGASPGSLDAAEDALHSALPTPAPAN